MSSDPRLRRIKSGAENRRVGITIRRNITDIPNRADKSPITNGPANEIIPVVAERIELPLASWEGVAVSFNRFRARGYVRPWGTPSKTIATTNQIELVESPITTTPTMVNIAETLSQSRSRSLVGCSSKNAREAKDTRKKTVSASWEKAAVEPNRDRARIAAKLMIATNGN